MASIKVKSMKPMTACRYSKTYKATKAPTCGCDKCDMIWRFKQVYEELSKKAEQTEYWY